MFCASSFTASVSTWATVLDIYSPSLINCSEFLPKSVVDCPCTSMEKGFSTFSSALLLNLLCHSPFSFTLRVAKGCLDILQLPSNTLREWFRFGLCPDIRLTYRLCYKEEHSPNALLYQLRAFRWINPSEVDEASNDRSRFHQPYHSNRTSQSLMSISSQGFAISFCFPPLSLERRG